MKPEYQDAVIAKCPVCKGNGEITVGCAGDEWIEKCPECEARLTELETEIIDCAREYRKMVSGNQFVPIHKGVLHARKALFDAVDAYEDELL